MNTVNKYIELLNYTGKRIGLVNDSGNPSKVLPSHGNARLETVTYRWSNPRNEVTKVCGLPSPDWNLIKFYIVTREVAEMFGPGRKDLLVPEEPFVHGGATYYRKLSKINY